MTIRSPLEHIRDTRLEKEWLAVANTPAKSNTTLTLTKLRFWTPFTQCFHILREAIKIFKHHYDLHPEYILGLQSEQSLVSPSTLLPNHTAPNWRAPCSTHPPLPLWQKLYTGTWPPPASQSLWKLQPSCMLKIMQLLCHKSQTYSYISETICKNLMFIFFFLCPVGTLITEKPSSENLFSTCVNTAFSTL